MVWNAFCRILELFWLLLWRTGGFFQVVWVLGCGHILTDGFVGLVGWGRRPLLLVGEASGTCRWSRGGFGEPRLRHTGPIWSRSRAVLFSVIAGDC